MLPEPIGDIRSNGVGWWRTTQQTHVNRKRSRPGKPLGRGLEDWAASSWASEADNVSAVLVVSVEEALDERAMVEVRSAERGGAMAADELEVAASLPASPVLETASAFMLVIFWPGVSIVSCRYLLCCYLVSRWSKDCKVGSERFVCPRRRVCRSRLAGYREKEQPRG